MHTSWIRVLAGTAVALAAIASAACTSVVPTPTKPAGAAPSKPGATAPAQTAGNVDAGKSAFQAKGCGACHVTKAVAGASGTTGPNLDGIASRPKIAATLDNNPDNLKKWLKNPGAVKPGTLMPNLNLSDAEIENLVAFLMTLK